MNGEDHSGGPLDRPTLDVLARRARTHPLVDSGTFQPDTISPRQLELRLDDKQYPPPVETARLDIRWFEGGDYTIHYLEIRGDTTWQCRWDRHPKPGEPTVHFHPPTDASSDIEPSGLQATHHLGVLFGVLDWVSDRVERLHDG